MPRLKWRSLFNAKEKTLGAQFLVNDPPIRVISSIVGGDILIVSAEFSVEDMIGHRNVQTSVQLRDDTLIGGRCSCDRTGWRSTCVHQAAVLLWLEQDPESPFVIAEKKKEQEREEEMRRSAEEARLRVAGHVRIFPFRDWNGNPILEISRALQELPIYRYEWNRAIAAADAEPPIAVKLLEATSTEMPGIDLRDEGSSVTIRGGQVEETECTHSRTCTYYGMLRARSGEPCPHILRLLAWLWLHPEKTIGVDDTDPGGRSLISAFSGQGTALSTGQIRLSPTVVRSDDRIYLSFRIGRGRLYTVRNLNTLSTTVAENGTMPAGKDEQLQLFPGCFDEEGAQWFELIRAGTEQLADALSLVSLSGYYGKGPSYGRNTDLLPVSGITLDRLYRIAEPKEELPFRDKDSRRQKEGTIFFRREDPQIVLKVARVRSRSGMVTGMSLTGEIPRMINGAENSYTLSVDPDGNAELDLISRELEQKMLPLKRLIRDGRLNIRFGLEHKAEFWHDILPRLRAFARVEIEEGLEEEAPVSPEFSLYLDAAEGIPFAGPVIRYGDQAYSLSALTRADPAGRFISREKAFLELAGEYFPVTAEDGDQIRSTGEPDDIWRLLNEGLDRLSETAELHSTAAFDALLIRKQPRISIGVSLRGNLLDLKVSSEFDEEELLAFLESCRLKKRYHRLRSGSYLRIDEAAEEINALSDALHLTPRELIRGREGIPAYRALYLDRMLEECTQMNSVRDHAFRKMAREFRSVSDSDHEVPESLKGVLRGYQAAGYQWLRTIADYGFGGILADDMGLGKTVQMIAVLLAEKTEGTEGTSLVVCPASVVYNWLAEFMKFAPKLNVAVCAGNAAQRKNLIAGMERYDVIITSYDLLKRDIPYYEGKQFLYEVLDEAQYIKTHSTGAAKAVKVIFARHRFALTGTPIENRLSELWSIFDYLMPGFLYTYETFRSEMETPIVKKKDEAAKKRLARMAAPFILRRLKEDVLKDLPEKLEEVRYAVFGEEQKHLYEAQAAALRQQIEASDDDQRSRIRILAGLTRLRQICCDPSLAFENEGPVGSAKREMCLDLVRSAIDAGHRILLFSQFTSMLELLSQDLDREGVSYDLLTGATAKQHRMRKVKAFNEGTTSVFLISLKAGGNGLNLTGADVVIHYDPWWNLAAQDQATDRAHRIGQTRKVNVYRLVIRESVEEKILELQEKKKDLAEGILSGELGSITSMTKDEILGLLN